jgi:hypothetical protein
MNQHVLLRLVTAEWDAKARIHREAARYWDITRQSAKDEAEEKRASERYHLEMQLAKYAHDKLKLCLDLRCSL